MIGMMLSRTARSRLALALASSAIALAIAGGIVNAAIPGASGTISACSLKAAGTLRVIDTEAGEACAPVENPLSWPSQSGGPVAYALVDAGGGVDPTQSMVITTAMVSIEGGAGADEYCFDVPVAVRNVMATLHSSSVLATPTVRLGQSGACPAGTDFSVMLRNASGFGVGGAFYVLVL